MFQSMIIGLGQIGLMYDFDEKRNKPSSHTLAFELNDKIQLVAASDLNSEKKLLLHQLSPKADFYTDTLYMLNQHKADVISICTTPKNHLQIIEHVIMNTNTRIIFCEKPVVNTIEEADILLSMLENSHCVLIPNLSRRWNLGMKQVYKTIKENMYGPLLKINFRYTRGILNTGSHIFDLVNWFAGKLERLLVTEQVCTSAEQDGDLSFSFQFITEKGIPGFSEAFNDEFYYMFEMDLFFEQGKIEISESGNKIKYYHVENHPLFSGFKSLHLTRLEDEWLQDSNLQNAILHLVKVLENEEEPICTLVDGLLPIYIADALRRSNVSRSWQVVNY